MKRHYILLCIVMLSSHLFSQQLFLKAGKNFTKYAYKDSDGQANLNLKSGEGSFYELGVALPLTNKHFMYSASLVLNEYNAMGGNTANSYRWDTHYLGIKGGFEYSFFPEKNSRFTHLDLILNAGLLGQTIVYGKQEINGTYYDLVENKEFSGVVIGSSAGCQVKYAIQSFGIISINYNYQHSLNVSNNTPEKVSFNTHQVGLGFHFPFN